MPHEFQALGKHISASAVYLLNFTLKSEGGYFDVSAEEKPLLHLWSLSVGHPRDITIQRRRSPMESTMSSKTDQIKGLASQAVGKLKVSIGKITGSKQMQAKGAAQEVKGQAQQTIGKAKSALKDTAEKVADKKR